MKKLILIVVLFISGNVFSQLGDYFISNNHSKAKGLNFKIKKPLDFKQSEAFSSNTVQKWEKMGSYISKIYGIEEKRHGGSRKCGK